MLSLKLSDWIHAVQTIFRLNNSVNIEGIKTNPKGHWDKFERIIDLVEFLTDTETNTFNCKFKIKAHLTEGCTGIYEFNQDTVPSNFLL